VRKGFLMLAGFAWVAVLFVFLAPLALAWPTLAWRNRISLLAGDLWGRGCLFFAGIRVDYSGLEHLRARPAILLFNHSSYLDFFVNAALAEHRCLVFGKRELVQIPFLGWGWRLGGHPLIQREERRHWQVELDRAEQLLKTQGYSTIIAPEGRRSRDGILLPFKKGAFHLAINTGLPILPVVIKGSAPLMKGGVPHPGKIVVKVLPPIPTTDWSAERIEEHLIGVRERYLAELGQSLAASPVHVYVENG